MGTRACGPTGSEGNYATCTRCTDPYGGPSVGNCVVHPDHCNGAADRDACLFVCSRGLLLRAAAALEGMDVRTMAGDFNCTPRDFPCDGGGVSIAECPWLSTSNTFRGMEVCFQTGGTAAVGGLGCGGGIIGAGCPNCILDFVLSTDCGCGDTRVVTNGIDYGDHRTIIFGQHSQPVLEYVPGTSHRLVHGHFDVRYSDGSTARFHESWDSVANGAGASCGAGVNCGGLYHGGTVVAAENVCEGRQQVRVRQPAGCVKEAKALVCANAGAWGLASGQASGHGAATAPPAGANATASGNSWQGRCDRQRRIVDLRRITFSEIASDPIQFLTNADAFCTARQSNPHPDPEPDPEPEPEPEPTPGGSTTPRPD